MRNPDYIQIVTTDKGYDWDDFREELREADVRPVVKHREFSPLDIAHDARRNADTYHRRSVVESVSLHLNSGPETHFGLERGLGSSENSS